MAINERPKRRARRIAADEAHSWARNLRLGNHHAKSVLRSLTLYVDGDGACFVGVEQLADDCELSADTVRRRLQWLEDIGAIARIPQWIDRHGRRCSDEGGKRTTDLIRLLYAADQDEIEACAAGRTDPKTRAISTPFSPSQQQGLNPDQDSVSPAPALGQPSHYGEGLTSEPEPEPESPLTPPGESEGVAARIEESEPEHFGPAWSQWRAPIRRDLALAEFRELSPEKQRLCRAAVPLFNAALDKLGRKHVMNFHLWIRSKGFDDFPGATLSTSPAQPERRWLCGDELAGLLVALQMADRVAPRLVDDPDRGRGIWSTSAPRPDLAALAKFKDGDPLTWQILQRGTPQFAAWRDRLKLWLGGEIEPRKVFLEAFDASVHGHAPDHPNFKFRKSSTGLPVPTPWPPHRDGSWPNENSEVA